MKRSCFPTVNIGKPNNWPSYKKEIIADINIYINSDIVEERLEIFMERWLFIKTLDIRIIKKNYL